MLVVLAPAGHDLVQGVHSACTLCMHNIYHGSAVHSNSHLIPKGVNYSSLKQVLNDLREANRGQCVLVFDFETIGRYRPAFAIRMIKIIMDNHPSNQFVIVCRGSSNPFKRVEYICRGAKNKAPLLMPLPDRHCMPSMTTVPYRSNIKGYFANTSLVVVTAIKPKYYKDSLLITQNVFKCLHLHRRLTTLWKTLYCRGLSWGHCQ